MADDRPSPWRVEGAPGGGDAKPPERPARFRPPGGGAFWLILAVLFVVNWVVASQVNKGTTRVSVPYTVFRAQVQTGNVKEISTRGDTIQGVFRAKVRYPSGKGGKASTHFKTVRPSFGNDGLLNLLLSKNVVVNAHPVDQGPSLISTLLFSFGPTILLVLLFVFLMRRAAGGVGGLGGIGRSRARRYQPSEQRVTFDDVAGIDEAEEELVEIVDFLRDPGKYRRLGGAIPRGVLLSGLPGTGKTLLARAVAGEANVPFFSMAASEFVEAIVGVGASRVRDLFTQAKEAAP